MKRERLVFFLVFSSVLLWRWRRILEERGQGFRHKRDVTTTSSLPPLPLAIFIDHEFSFGQHSYVMGFEWLSGNG